MQESVLMLDAAALLIAEREEEKGEKIKNEQLANVMFGVMREMYPQMIKLYDATKRNFDSGFKR